MHTSFFDDLNTNTKTQVLTDEEALVNQGQLQELSSEYTLLCNRIEYVSDLWSQTNRAIDGTSAVVQHGNITTKTELALLNGALDAVLSKVNVESKTVALESFTVDSKEEIGLELFKRAKDTIVKLIEWFVNQFKALYRNIKEFFKRYFGQVTRIQKNIDKQREVLAKKLSGSFDLKEKDFDGGNWVSAIQLNGKLATVSELTTGLGDYQLLSESYEKAVIGGLNSCVTKFGSLIEKVNVSDGEEAYLSSVVDTNAQKHSAVIDITFSKLLKEKVSSQDPRFSTVVATSFSKTGLLGNHNLYRTKPKTKPETLAEKASALLQDDILLKNLKWKQGESSTEGKVPTLTLDECGEVLSSVDSCLSAVSSLVDNKEMISAIDSLDKVFATFDKMKSRFKAEEFTPQLRQYLQMMGNQLTAYRKQMMDTPRAISIAGTAAINSALNYTGKSISNYKKV